MTDDELLLHSYKAVLEHLKACKAHYLKDNFDYTQDLIDDCSDCIEILEDILSDLSGVESLSELDEEDYAFMFEMLSAYEEIFIVDGREPSKLKQDTKTHEQLARLIEKLEENYVPQDYEFDEEDEDDDL